MSSQQDPCESTRIFLRYSVTLIFLYWTTVTIAGGFIRENLQTLFSINAFYAVLLALLLDIAMALFIRFQLHQLRGRIHLYKIGADAFTLPAILLSRKLADAQGGLGVWSPYTILHWLTLVLALALFFVTVITLPCSW